MKYLHKILAVALAAFFVAGSALAQNAGTVTNHAFALGKGAGTTGYTSLLCASAQLAVGQSAADPICQTITGDVTITSGGVTAIGASKVTNSQLNTMAANTTKCNATAGTANPTDCIGSTMRTNLGLVIGTNVEAWDNDLDCIAALSSTGQIKRTGTGTCSAGSVALADLATGTQDTVIGYFGSTTSSAVAIANCTGALTYSTATHTFGCNTSTSGSVTSAQISAGTGIAVSGTCTITTTGNCTVSRLLTNATLQASPGNPTGSASATGVMMGLGTTCTLTPVFSTRISVRFEGNATNAAVANIGHSVRFGTGTAPINNAALSGTVVGNTLTTAIYTAGNGTAFSHGGVITGLTAGTAYWFDLGLSSSTGTGSINSVSCSVREF